MTTAPLALKRILLVEDDAAFAELLTYALEERGFAVNVVQSAREARWMLRDADDAPFHLVVSDVRLPRGPGTDLLSSADLTARGTQLILMTAFPSNELRAFVEQAGGELFEKPFALDALCDRIAARLEVGPA